MNPTSPIRLLLTTTAALALTASAIAAEVRNYELQGLTDNGWEREGTVKIIWQNIQGLDAISGTINYGAGQQSSFTGQNSRSGFIWWTDGDGVRSELSKVKNGSSFAWQGKTIYRGHQPAIRLVPIQGGANVRPSGNTKPSGNANVTRRSYWATEAGGARFTTTINWHNIKGLGDIDGHFDVSGTRRSFSGRNSESGYIWFKDTGGNRYDLWKKNSGGKVNWSGTVTTPTGKEFTFSMTSK